jgi:hypothetical protein
MWALAAAVGQSLHEWCVIDVFVELDEIHHVIF